MAMTYDDVQPGTRVICHSRGEIKGTVLGKFKGGKDGAEAFVKIEFDGGGVAFNHPEQISPFDGAAEIDVPAIIASRPTGEDTAPLLVDPNGARVVPAREVREFDTILAGIDPGADGYRADWFNAEYTAHPRPFDPTCLCGVCELADPAEGPHVVLTDGSAAYGPWETCDPWPAERLVLIVPA